MKRNLFYLFLIFCVSCGETKEETDMMHLARYYKASIDKKLGPAPKCSDSLALLNHIDSLNSSSYFRYPAKIIMLKLHLNSQKSQCKDDTLRYVFVLYNVAPHTKYSEYYLITNNSLLELKPNTLKYSK